MFVKLLQGTILEELQTRLRDLEEEKSQTQREAEELRNNVSELKQKLSSFSPDSDMVHYTLCLLGVDLSNIIHGQCSSRSACTSRRSDLRTDRHNPYLQIPGERIL